MMEDGTSPSLSNSEKEERRRVFWSVYMLDRLASCARARPPAILEASCHLALPCDENLFRAEFPSPGHKLDDILGAGTAPSDPHPGFPALVMVVVSILGRCVQCMLQDDHDRPRKPLWDPHSEYAAICSALLSLESYFEQPVEEALLLNCSVDGVEIDRSVAGPLLFSRVLFCMCHCLLNQPFLLRRSADLSHARAPQTFMSRALDTGREYSKRLLLELHNARQVGYGVTGSFYAYCTVVAGVIQAIHSSSAQETVHNESTNCLSMACQITTELAQHWPSCVSMVSPPFLSPSFSSPPPRLTFTIE